MAWGCVPVLCLLLVPLVISILATRNAELVHTGGPAPRTERSARHATPHGPPEDLRYAYTWRVRASLESTLSIRRPRAPLSLGHIDDGSGALNAYGPAGCETRAIRWRITVNGREADAGTFRGDRSYGTSSDYSSDGDLDTVVVAADWDGGTEACPRFRLVWDTEALEP